MIICDFFYLDPNNFGPDPDLANCPDPVRIRNTAEEFLASQTWDRTPEKSCCTKGSGRLCSASQHFNSNQIIYFLLIQYEDINVNGQNLIEIYCNILGEFTGFYFYAAVDVAGAWFLLYCKITWLLSDFVSFVCSLSDKHFTEY